MVEAAKPNKRGARRNNNQRHGGRLYSAKEANT
jgi:hypothetical protein